MYDSSLHPIQTYLLTPIKARASARAIEMFHDHITTHHIASIDRKKNGKEAHSSQDTLRRSKIPSPQLQTPIKARA